MAKSRKNVPKSCNYCKSKKPAGMSNSLLQYALTTNPTTSAKIKQQCAKTIKNVQKLYNTVKKNCNNVRNHLNLGPCVFVWVNV